MLFIFNQGIPIPLPYSIEALESINKKLLPRLADFGH